MRYRVYIHTKLSGNIVLACEEFNFGFEYLTLTFKGKVICSVLLTDIAKVVIENLKHS